MLEDMFTRFLKTFTTYLKTCLYHVWKYVYTMFETCLHDIWRHIQGVPKRMRLFFCLIFRQPMIGFSNRFFLLKTEIYTHIKGGREIHKTKCGSETDQFIFVLSHTGLKTAKFGPSSANLPKTGSDSSQVASTGPSNPNWLNRYYKYYSLDHFQNMWAV